MYLSKDYTKQQYQYRSVIAGVRICQLYFFTQMFILLGKPFWILLQTMVYLLSVVLSSYINIQAIANPDWSSLSVPWSLLEVLFLINIWLIYYYYSSFRKNYWIVVLCFIALAHSVYSQVIPRDPLLISPTTDGLSQYFGQLLMYTAYGAGTIVAHTYFLYIAVRGQRVLHQIDKSSRSILSEYLPNSALVQQSLMGLFNVPPAVRYARNQLWTGLLNTLAGVANFLNYWRLSLGFVLVCLIPWLYIALAPNATAIFLALLVGENIVPNILSLLTVIILPSILIFIMWLFIYYIRAVGRVAITSARNAMRKTLQDIQHEDSRAPVLFLRSFLNDRVDLTQRKFNLEQWMLDAGSRSITLDDIMLAEGTMHGPTVALGNPDDTAPPYGVARGYFEHDSWKQAVTNLCRDSQLIIMVLDSTAGVDWEISHIVEQHYASKTLFLIAPQDAAGSTGTDLLVRALSSIDPSWYENESACRTAVSESAPFGFEVSANGEIALLTCSVISSYTYLVAVREFMRKRLRKL